MSVDAHIHFWRLARGDNTHCCRRWRRSARSRADRSEPQLEAAGIGRIVVVHAAETLAENLYTLGLAARFPWIAGVVGWIDPPRPPSSRRLRRSSRQSAVQGSARYATTIARSPGCSTGGSSRGSAAFHQAGLGDRLPSPEPRRGALVTHLLAARHPASRSVSIIAASPTSGRAGIEPWASTISRPGPASQGACKLSGLLNCARAWLRAGSLAAVSPSMCWPIFGPERTLWASDRPPLLLSSDYPAWWRMTGELLAGSATDQRDAVLGGTAARIYRLEAAHG